MVEFKRIILFAAALAVSAVVGAPISASKDSHLGPRGEQGDHDQAPPHTPNLQHGVSSVIASVGLGSEGGLSRADHPPSYGSPSKKNIVQLPSASTQHKSNPRDRNKPEASAGARSAQNLTPHAAQTTTAITPAQLAGIIRGYMRDARFLVQELNRMSRYILRFKDLEQATLPNIGNVLRKVQHDATFVDFSQLSLRKDDDMKMWSASVFREVYETDSKDYRGETPERLTDSMKPFCINFLRRRNEWLPTQAQTYLESTNKLVEGLERFHAENPTDPIATKLATQAAALTERVERWMSKIPSVKAMQEYSAKLPSGSR